MGIADIFGSGKKAKSRFTIPDEVSVLRTKIEAENRENYPNVVRYQEIETLAREAYKKLNALIAQAEYSDEAVRMKEDIQRRLDQLTKKINQNRMEARREAQREAGKANNQDYVESNLAYLERKGRRNQAKTLFTECLEKIQSIKTYCNEARLEHGMTIESVTSELTKAMAALNTNFFDYCGEDNEIKVIRDALLAKIQDLVGFIEENRERLREKGLEAKTQASREEIVRAATAISGKVQG